MPEWIIDGALATLFGFIKRDLTKKANRSKWRAACLKLCKALAAAFADDKQFQEEMKDTLN